MFFLHTKGFFSTTPNFFNVTLPGFIRVESSHYALEERLPEKLYTPVGSGRAMIGSLYKEFMGLTLDNNFLLSVETQQTKDEETNNLREVKKYEFNTLAFMNGAPFFDFSQYPIRFDNQDIYVSLPTFSRLTNGKHRSIEEIPMKYFLVKFVNGITDAQIDQVKRSMNDIIGKYAGVGIWDYRDEIQPFETATIAMNFFFTFTTIVAMLISFFSLLSSMFTNIYEQTKEIAVLRALGVPKWWMIRIYVHEAFILVFSSSMLGLLIGMTVSYSMTSQQILFTQLPIPFVFPWLIFIIVFVCSIVFGLIAAYSPIKLVVDKQVVQIFRLIS